MVQFKVVVRIDLIPMDAEVPQVFKPNERPPVGQFVVNTVAHSTGFRFSGLDAFIPTDTADTRRPPELLSVAAAALNVVRDSLIDFQTGTPEGVISHEMREYAPDGSYTAHQLPPDKSKLN